jgi:hypothetical protein
MANPRSGARVNFVLNTGPNAGVPRPAIVVTIPAPGGSGNDQRPAALVVLGLATDGPPWSARPANIKLNVPRDQAAVAQGTWRTLK